MQTNTRSIFRPPSKNSTNYLLDKSYPLGDVVPVQNVKFTPVPVGHLKIEGITTEYKYLWVCACTDLWENKLGFVVCPQWLLAQEWTTKAGTVQEKLDQAAQGKVLKYNDPTMGEMLEARVTDPRAAIPTVAIFSPNAIPLRSQSEIDAIQAKKAKEEDKSESRGEVKAPKLIRTGHPASVDMYYCVHPDDLEVPRIDFAYRACYDRGTFCRGPINPQPRLAMSVGPRVAWDGMVQLDGRTWVEIDPKYTQPYSPYDRLASAARQGHDTTLLSLEGYHMVRNGWTYMSRLAPPVTDRKSDLAPGQRSVWWEAGPGLITGPARKLPTGELLNMRVVDCSGPDCRPSPFDSLVTDKVVRDSMVYAGVPKKHIEALYAEVVGLETPTPEPAPIAPISLASPTVAEPKPEQDQKPEKPKRVRKIRKPKSTGPDIGI